MKILVLNSGSSSQKSCLFEVGDALPASQPTPLWEADADGDTLRVSTATGAKLEEKRPADSPDATEHLLRSLWNGPTRVVGSSSEIDIVGHRVVHGGREFRQPTRIDAAVKAAIEKLSPLAPSHNPVALAGIEAVERLFGDVPQIAVFDTAFHADLPDVAAIYPLPFAWAEQGIRRYGFHGISHGDCAARAAKILGRPLESLRLITCHLGNGCSLCAIENGKSIETTMGFTPLEGLMMGTRCGSIDAGIVLYLLREKKMEANELDHILNKESGLKGVSGLSGDLREIEAAMKNGHERARLAFEMDVHRLCAGIGAMLGNLGGLDALVFTGGIGEHSAAMRAATGEKLVFLGVRLDAAKNENSPRDADIAAPDSPVRVLVIEAQEDWAIARECWHLAVHP